MLARSHRLPPPLIQEVLVRGRRLSSRFFSGKALFLKDNKQFRVACVVSKKTARTAVRRNRLRRRTAALLRELLGAHHASLALVIFPTAAVFDANLEDVRADLDKFLGQLLTRVT